MDLTQYSVIANLNAALLFQVAGPPLIQKHIFHSLLAENIVTSPHLAIYLSSSPTKVQVI